MQTRMVFNLVNQATIFSDWKQNSRAEVENEINENLLPRFSTITYYKSLVDGIMRIIPAGAVTDFYVEERDETKF